MAGGVEEDEAIGVLIDFTWQVQRHARVTEVVQNYHGMDHQKYKVEVWDKGRSPFITKWFNDPVAASDFAERLKLSGEEELTS